MFPVWELFFIERAGSGGADCRAVSAGGDLQLLGASRRLGGGATGARVWVAGIDQGDRFGIVSRHVSRHVWSPDDPAAEVWPRHRRC